MRTKRILALGPHTDDVELGCGGTLAKLIEKGTDVHVAIFSIAAASVPEGMLPTTLKDESVRAIRQLGISDSKTHIYDYPVRRFPDYRQEILENILKLKHEIVPDMVLLPSSSDIHQDHSVVHTEGLRAFKEITVLGYELPWNTMSFQPQAFSILDVHHLNIKWQSLSAYKSQIILARPYFDKSFILGLAKMRGVQIKCEWAEAYEVLRLRWC